ncbi:MAG: AhpA/YtjB family protein [Glaciecola sp.]
MNNKDDNRHMSQAISHNYSIFKRISTLIIVILCVVIAVNLYLMHTQNADKWYQIESEQLGRSLTQQAAKLVAAPLAKNDATLLEQYITLVSEGMFVQNAVMFDQLGIKYAQQEDQMGIVDMIKTSNIEPLVFVEDIIFDDNTIGYIKLVLDKQAVTHHHRVFNKNQLSQTVLVVVLSIILAGLVTRAFYKMRHQYRLSSEDDTLI